MKFTILVDAREKPELFSWAGPIQQSILESWLERMGWNVPPDLKSLWLETGGGDFLESETIFAPFSDLSVDDSVEAANRLHHAAGLPDSQLAFHTGLRLSVVDLAAKRYKFIRARTYEVIEEFSSFEKWYVDGVRPEYEARYSLSALKA